MKQFFGIALIGLVGLSMLMTTTKKVPDTDNLDGYKIGEVVEDFTLKNTEGDMVSLKGYIDQSSVKGVIVIFTCNTCPYAVAYEDRIIDLHNNFLGKGYPVLAINPNDPAAKPGDSYDKMKERAAEKSFPFAYTIDETQEVVKRFGATKTPHVFLVDSEMSVRYIGAIDNNATDPSGVSTRYVEDAIKAIDTGSNPDPATTKAVGCSIKIRKGA